MSAPVFEKGVAGNTVVGHSFNPGQDRYSRRLLDGPESQVVQYLQNVVYPDCLRVFSSFTSGPGQLVWGKHCKKRVDLMVLAAKGKLCIFQVSEAAGFQLLRVIR